MIYIIFISYQYNYFHIISFRFPLSSTTEVWFRFWFWFLFVCAMLYLAVNGKITINIKKYYRLNLSGVMNVQKPFLLKVSWSNICSSTARKNLTCVTYVRGHLMWSPTYGVTWELFTKRRSHHRLNSLVVKSVCEVLWLIHLSDS